MGKELGHPCQRSDAIDKLAEFLPGLGFFDDRLGLDLPQLGVLKPLRFFLVGVFFRDHTIAAEDPLREVQEDCRPVVSSREIRHAPPVFDRIAGHPRKLGEFSPVGCGSPGDFSRATCGHKSGFP